MRVSLPKTFSSGTPKRIAPSSLEAGLRSASLSSTSSSLSPHAESTTSGAGLPPEPNEPARAPPQQAAVAGGPAQSAAGASGTAGAAAEKSHVALTMCVLLVLLGCSTCAVAWAMQRVIESLQFAHRRIEFMDSGHFVADVAAWAGFRVLLVLAAVFCTASISPRAAGSGIPEMKCILAGMNLDEHMNNTTVLAKVMGLVLMCGAGMPVGREGPLVHIAGSIALGLLRLPVFKSISHSEVRKHEVLGAACAVGVTAAFGAPLGGVLFSIEATTTYFLTSSYWHSFVCAVTGCVFFRYADAHGGMGTESSELGANREQLISSQLFEIDYAVLPAHVLLGGVCGLLASAFISIAAHLFRFTRPWSKQHTELDEYTLTPRTRHHYRMLTMRYRKYWYAAGVALLGGLAEYSIASGGGVHSDESSGGFMTSGLFKCTYDFMYFEDLSNATGTFTSLSLDSWAVQHTVVSDTVGTDTAAAAAASSTRPVSIGGSDESLGLADGMDSAEKASVGQGDFDDTLQLCSAARYGVASQSSHTLQTTVYNEDWGEYGGVIGSLCVWCSAKLVFASLSLTIFAPAGCLGPCIAIGKPVQYSRQ
jgi:H+/Cl- antiporter ClcA|eukprot:COSAG06_NODE_4082_length_4593_cov_4.561638_3_plen_592_part_00